ncbi:MAG: tRNA (adenosine(37)-N6)-threonylcarbamoyltransferase complex dimerization subunit type 1 TsaB [Methylobacteriaceae bacterium]|jgi:tRNA threonylcarbamoyl adenosine modification protein YeaZ|nr:tRNA (adenosine(37)-N6)-threonylcarbamoyltransferase complex dimerization subunit type 1 TsaB [Methylobacteriaceae bacterium]
MNILALDTALGACSVSVFDAATDTVTASESVVMERGHAEVVMPMVSRVMEQSGLTFAELDRVAVTVGPGSYTGIRVGIAAARGIGLAAAKPVVGVSTLSALLAPVMGFAGKGLSAAAIDARHGFVYFQAVAHGGKPLCPACYLEVPDARRIIGAGPVMLCGSGGALVAYDCLTHGIDAQLSDEPDIPNILWVAKLGAIANPKHAPSRPLYLKGADAKPQTRSAVPRRQEH